MGKNERKGFLAEVASEEMIGTSTSNNQTMIRQKSVCEDKLKKKICVKKKKKNNGIGCKNKATKKRCKKTCGLCDDGELN